MKLGQYKQGLGRSCKSATQRILPLCGGGSCPVASQAKQAGIDTSEARRRFSDIDADYTVVAQRQVCPVRLV